MQLNVQMNKFLYKWDTKMDTDTEEGAWREEKWAHVPGFVKKGKIIN